MLVPKISSPGKGTTKCKIIFSTYKSARMNKNQNLYFSIPHAANYQLPDSTTSVSGVLFGCSEIDRSGLAFQTTLLLFVDLQRL